MLFAQLFISTALAAEPVYVSTRDLAEQFGLKEMAINDETVRLESRTVSIHLAALKNERVERALELIRQGADLSVRDPDGGNSVYVAIAYKCYAAVEPLVKMALQVAGATPV